MVAGEDADRVLAEWKRVALAREAAGRACRRCSGNRHAACTCPEDCGWFGRCEGRERERR